LAENIITRDSQEPVIAHLVFNLISKLHIKISGDSFFFFSLQFEISANSNGSHLGSKIIAAQVSIQKILRQFFFSKYAKSVLIG